MAYRFQVNQHTCINCGICMDLCPVRCLDMTRPSGEGERATPHELLTPIPCGAAAQPWMMLAPVQVAPCVGCQICAQECPTNAITIESSVKELAFAHRGLVTFLPPEQGWQPLDAYTRSTPEEPGDTPWGMDTTGTLLSGRPPGKAGAPGWVSAKRTYGPPARPPVPLAPTQDYMSA